MIVNGSKKIFQFDDIKGCEEAICRTWNDFRDALGARAFAYDDFISAQMYSVFFHQFCDMFSGCHTLFEKTVKESLSPPLVMTRAARVAPDGLDLTYNRFIPNKEYMRSHNRFSPPGVEWLYLALGEAETSEKCALKECRASEGDLFGLCCFTINEEYSEKVLVDLTIAETFTYYELNNQLETCAEDICQRNAKEAIESITQGGELGSLNLDEVHSVVKRWVAYNYSKLLCEQIFVPIDTWMRELVYAPFQCMASYFASLGYEGIIYSSTVYPKGKNVVLFDKEAAFPFGEIRRVNI